MQSPSTNPELRNIRDLAAAIAVELERKGLVAPIKPFAVSQENAGVLIGVSARTIRNLVAANKLAACHITTGTVRIPLSSIEALLASTSSAAK